MAGIRIREINIEKKGSPVKWDKADPSTAKKIAAAIKSKSATRFCEILLFTSTVFLLYVVVGCVIEASKVSFPESLVLYLLGVFLPCLILCLLKYKYSKERPYLYPERQAVIWIYRTTCCGRKLSGGRYTSHSLGYYAYFNSKGGQIHIPISQEVYDSNPVGKKYIFYKFNNRTGNRWAAIPEEKLDPVLTDE